MDEDASAPAELQRDLVLREYELHQKAIEKFDGHRFQIRNWSILIVVAIVTVAVQSDEPGVALIALVAAGVFAVAEAFHLALTLSVIDRATDLEELLVPGAPPEVLMAYHFGVSSAYAGNTTLLDAAKLLFMPGRWHITFFYIAMVGGAALSAVLLAIT